MKQCPSANMQNTYQPHTKYILTYYKLDTKLSLAQGACPLSERNNDFYSYGVCCLRAGTAIHACIYVYTYEYIKVGVHGAPFVIPDHKINEEPPYIICMYVYTNVKHSH